MSRFPLAIPPGVFRNGTDFQSAGRYEDAFLVRWYGKAVGPIGGWRARGAGAVSGAARAMLPWKDNSSVTRIAIATNSKLYVSDRAGTLFDITPTGFVVGRVTATASGGYGSGLYGKGTYGTPRPDTTTIQDATQCSLDTFGENLLFISPNDGKLYKWLLNTATPAEQISGSPTGTAIVVTGEGFIFVLGSTDPRTVSWCDQRNDTVWTPDATNQAGDFALQTPGKLLCGRNIQGGTILLTDQDAWVATYEASNDVYGFDRKGDGCGGISRQCLVPFNMQAAWMSPGGTFWRYNGYVLPIECDVLDYIQSDINLLQSSKVFGVHNSAYSEIAWYYCSASSNEIDRCVVWNYKGDPDNGVGPYWNIGRVSRLCGADKQAGFQYPVAVDSTGLVYDHEVGTNFGGLVPYAESGPVTIGNGDNVMHVQQLYPDDLTVGDVTASFSVKNERDDSYTVLGPYSLQSKTDLRFVARQAKIRYTQNTMSAWRVGTPAVEAVTGGKR